MVKKTVSKRRTSTKKSATKKKAPKVRSFRISPEDRPFMTLQVTRESLYWLVLGAVVIAFTVWIMKLQSDIQAVYDSIEASENVLIDTPIKN